MISKIQAILFGNLEMILDQNKTMDIYVVKNQIDYFYCLTQAEADAVNSLFNGNCVATKVSIGQQAQNITESGNAASDATV